jgi:hypothetical protein
MMLIILGMGLFSSAFTQDDSNWRINFGIRGFKYSAENGPNEIQYNAVFERWEQINQNHSTFEVSEYKELDPLYFNINLGIDAFIRYNKYLLFKIGYDYSNPFGIGGKGQIAYREIASGNEIFETKEFSYTSHQINFFFGPVIPVNDGAAEIYMGFSPMSPTWVSYNEKFLKKENDETVTKYDKTFIGFFGSCRAMFGIQIAASEKIMLGTEAVFTFLSYMKLISGDIEDSSFRFPRMKWNFTLRYEIL